MTEVSALAATQWGLLTSAQAAAVGISRPQLARLTDRGVLERLTHGVYAATALGYEPHRDLRAAWLALDPARGAEERLASAHTAAVVSHTSAAGLHKLGDLLDDVHEFTLAQRKQSRREGVRLHRGKLAAQDVVLVHGLPTTTPSRTVADLLRSGHDMDHVAQIAADAVRRGSATLEQLANALDPLARRHSEPSGEALTARLLDIAGLSPQALGRQLVGSDLGQALLAAGRASVVGSLMHSVALKPLADVDVLAALPSVNLSAVVNFQPLLEAIQASQGTALQQVVRSAALDQLTGVVRGMDTRSLLDDVLVSVKAATTTAPVSLEPSRPALEGRAVTAPTTAPEGEDT